GGGAQSRRGKTQSGRGVRGFSLALLGEPVPGPSHLLHDLAVPLALGFLRQTAALLRKSPVFRCCFHAGITRRSSGAFRMHGGHAGRNPPMIAGGARASPPIVWAPCSR